MKRLLLLLAFVLLPLAAGAVETPVPAAPARWATDTAGFVSPMAIQVADRVLEDYERASGNQVLVWIGTTTGDTPLEDWTDRAFQAWKVGKTGLDNGVVLFIFATDRRVRLEVGYGLEATIPDALASRIVNDVVIPRIRAGERDMALQAGIDAIRSAIAGNLDLTSPAGEQPGPGVVSPTGAPAAPAREFTLTDKIVIGVAVIGFLILLITNPSLALYLVVSILTSGGGGGGSRSGGGGGFSGGGGRSGGGGASGSW